MHRSRPINTVFLVVVLVLGLSTRRLPELWPPVIQAYGGDTLWALFVYLGIGWVFVRWSPNRVALVALSFSVLIELSQLYHAPWIDQIRATTLGALILGHGFLWSDLACYAVGVGMGWVMEGGPLRREGANAA
ncbi:MAG: DUF2809 domain-containing protein [Verrucomicrobiota bacterium JB022]|nr:DUF2809 domain-containing protein [Verrucomicrobiota bacterium JB022]